MDGKTKGAGVLADMHPALFVVACVLSAICGVALACIIDATLLNAFASTANSARSVAFLILLLAGAASPPALLSRLRQQARQIRSVVQVSAPVPAEPPTTTPAQEPKVEPPPLEQQSVPAEARPEAQTHEAQEHKEQQEPQPQQAAQEPQGAVPAADQKAAPAVARPSATLGPILLDPVFMPRHHRKNHGVLMAAVAVVAAFAVGVLLGGKELAPYAGDIKAYAIDRLRDLLQTADIPMPGNETPVAESEFASVYKRLAIAPLPQSLERNSEVKRGLTRLRQEACDKQAIFSMGQALRESGDNRIAANAYLGFSAACGNGEGEGEKYAAAGIFYELADYDQVITIMTEMIAAHPAVPDYRYLRGEAFKDAKRYDEALTDYANTIELSSNRSNIGDWVFLEMSTAYAALKQYCAAITPIQTWVAIDPITRDAPKSRKLMLDYSQQGNCELHYATGSDSFPHDSGNQIRTKVTINGVEGNFVLDTGASFVTLTSEFATRSKVDVTRQSVTMETANGRADTTLGHAASVRVGRRIEATDVPILVQSRSLGREVDGLLGTSFLSRFELSIGKREWTLSPKK